MRRYGLLPPGTRVLIGLSGGSDSVALTRLLLDLAENGEFEVVGLAHFNHRLRRICRPGRSVLPGFREAPRIADSWWRVLTSPRSANEQGLSTRTPRGGSGTPS